MFKLFGRFVVSFVDGDLWWRSELELSTKSLFLLWIVIVVFFRNFILAYSFYLNLNVCLFGDIMMGFRICMWSNACLGRSCWHMKKLTSPRFWSAWKFFPCFILCYENQHWAVKSWLKQLNSFGQTIPRP